MKLLFLIISLLGICFSSGTSEVKKKTCQVKEATTSYQMVTGLLI